MAAAPMPSSSLLRKKMDVDPDTAKRNAAMAPTMAPPVINHRGSMVSEATPIGIEANNSAAKDTALSVPTNPALRWAPWLLRLARHSPMRMPLVPLAILNRACAEITQERLA